MKRPNSNRAETIIVLYAHDEKNKDYTKFNDNVWETLKILIKDQYDVFKIRYDGVCISIEANKQEWGYDLYWLDEEEFWRADTGDDLQYEIDCMVDKLRELKRQGKITQEEYDTIVNRRKDNKSED